MTELKVCDRCGEKHYNLYEHKFTNDMGEKVKMMLCWDCDFDIINGRGEYYDDEGEIALDREEQRYLDDPVNEPPPRWMR